MSSVNDATLRDLDSVGERRSSREGAFAPRDTGIISRTVTSWTGGQAWHERRSLMDGIELRSSSNHHGLFFCSSLQSRKAKIRVGGRPLSDGVAPNPCMIVRPALSELVETTTGGPDEYECVAILLEPDFVLKSADASHVRGLEILPSVSEGNELSWQLAKAIRDECLTGSPNGPFYTQTVAAMLSLHLVRHNSNLDQLRLPASKGGLSHLQLRTVIDYMIAHLAEDTCLRHLADMVGMSKSHFGRAFKASMGQAPLQWRKSRRLEHARELLCRSNQPLAEIALACGFANQSHFSTAFRGAVGASPAAWRRKNVP